MHHQNAPPIVGKFLVLAGRTAISQTIGYITLVVREYEEAIAFYTEKLGFKLVEDKSIANKRGVLVAPSGPNSPSLLLARAVTPEQKSRIGNQTGGHVFLFLHTDDFQRDYRDFISRVACASSGNPKRKATARWRCLKIYTATAGTSCNYGMRCDPIRSRQRNDCQRNGFKPGQFP